MDKVLILFAHPRLEKSRVNQMLIKHIPQRSNITFHDLYERYPDFNIDIEYEKELLSTHQIIIWQHPFYWYSAPALLKQWIDLVLEFQWAYGLGADALKDKVILNVITTGGARDSYEKSGHNRFTVSELLRPFEQTARLCKMIYLPPFTVQGTHRLTDGDLEKFANQYDILLQKLSGEDVNYMQLQKLELMNDICVLSKQE
ncbi:MAG: NAD(P)H-dependent oxidoreductase [Bacteroidales bacterium]|nr:NAD(P)H-dependent oxidoreductase [Bacteroidales bacterium]